MANGKVPSGVLLSPPLPLCRRLPSPPPRPLLWAQQRQWRCSRCALRAEAKAVRAAPRVFFFFLSCHSFLFLRRCIPSRRDNGRYLLASSDNPPPPATATLPALLCPAAARPPAAVAPRAAHRLPLTDTRGRPPALFRQARTPYACGRCRKRFFATRKELQQHRKNCTVHPAYRRNRHRIFGLEATSEEETFSFKPAMIIGDRSAATTPATPPSTAATPAADAAQASAPTAAAVVAAAPVFSAAAAPPSQMTQQQQQQQQAAASGAAAAAAKGSRAASVDCWYCAKRLATHSERAAHMCKAHSGMLGAKAALLEVSDAARHGGKGERALASRLASPPFSSFFSPPVSFGRSCVRPPLAPVAARFPCRLLSPPVFSLVVRRRPHPLPFAFFLRLGGPL